MSSGSPRIVIGAGRPNRLPALVAEYTIKKHCPNAEVIHTWDKPFCKDGRNNKIVRDSWDDECNWVPTPDNYPTGTLFSFCRVMVPEICGHEGRAIYIDADMILYGDVCELWDMPMGKAWVLRIPGQWSVCMFDCAAMAPYTLRNLLAEGYKYSQLLQCKYLPSKRVSATIPTTWNHTDRFQAGKTKLLHYTYMPTQPWVKPGHRAGGKWFAQLKEAVEAGAISEDLVRGEIRDGLDSWVAACWPQPHVLKEIGLAA
jgi:hypothetical protein